MEAERIVFVAVAIILLTALLFLLHRHRSALFGTVFLASLVAMLAFYLFQFGTLGSFTIQALSAKAEFIRQKASEAQSLVAQINQAGVAASEAVDQVRNLAKEVDQTKGEVDAAKQRVLEMDHQLQERIDQTLRQVEEAPGYAEVAHWTASGQYTNPFGTTGGPAYGWLDGYADALEGGGVRYKCESSDVDHYQQIAKRFPQYPFPYWVIAACLKNHRDEAWRIYAQDGLRHVEHTTKVPGHNEEHDWLLNKLREMLGDERQSR